MSKSNKTLSLALILVLITTSTPLLSFEVAAESQSSVNSNLSPPSVQFSIDDGTILYALGNISIGFAVTGSGSSESIVMSHLDLVSYKASWQSNSIVVYKAGSSNRFFYSVDLTNAPLGTQQIVVTATSSGIDFGGGELQNPFSLTSSSTLTFTLAAPPSVTPQPNNSSAWSIQTLDKNGVGGVGERNVCPIVLDSNNVPHVAYGSFAASASLPLLIYASWNGIAWSKQTVDEGSPYNLILDKTNNPHIVYENGDLKYASWTGTQWIIQDVDKGFSNNFGETSGAIALDSAGNPHIAYTDGKTVKYASVVDGKWQIQVIDTVDLDYQIPFQISIAIDQNNSVYVLYGYPSTYYNNITNTNDTTITLKLATEKNSIWKIQTVDLVPPITAYGNMVLDQYGNPQFICSQSQLLKNYTTVDTILYVSWYGATWKSQNLVSNVQLAISSPDTNWVNMGYLALDASNNPHITYTTAAGELMYASWTGKSWKIMTAAASGSATEPGFLALDSEGNPHICYYGPIDHEAGYAGMTHYVNITYATASKPEQIMTASSGNSEFINQKLPAIIVLIAVALIAAAIIEDKRHRKTTK